jgi:two-component sensor histidine kinase
VGTLISLVLIVNELVSNSLKYAWNGQAGEINVSLNEVKDHLELKVKDNGQGMTEAIRVKLGSSFGCRFI